MNLNEIIEKQKNIVAANPQSAEAHFALAHLYNQSKRLNEALLHYSKSLELDPGNLLARVNMAIVLQRKGELAQAIPHYLHVLSVNPNNVDILSNLGAAYRGLARQDQAEAIYKLILSIDPNHQKTLHNYANLLKDYGMLDEAIAYYYRALAISPGNPLIYTNILLSAVYASSFTPRRLYDFACEFGRNIADPLRRTRQLNIDKTLQRKLRIGYVSPDFRDHPVHYFLEHLIKNHNRDKFEIFAYSNTLKEDDVTERLSKSFDYWRNIRDRNDDEAADIIEADKIDILIDLAGHTADNRLLIFARKPAPIQATWLGYPATTGMKAMDYRIVDAFTEPEDQKENMGVERLLRLPNIFCCYQGHASNPAVIDHPPYEDNGYITFGCFNSFTKVSDDCLAAWAEILNAVPESRLLLELSGLDWQKFRTELEYRLKRAGLPRDRVILEPRRKSNQFVLYNKIDIALDPFPCVGGTTSMDTVWMGVPFITLAGDSFASRMGVSILTNVGLPELIADNNEEYVDKAIKLATDREALAEMRKDLRSRALASPLMDQKGFARDMEDTYRAMWYSYCEGKYLAENQ